MLDQTELVIDAGTGSFQTAKVPDPGIIGPIDYGFRKYKELGGACVVFGNGALAPSNIPGTKRLMFSGYSPLWTHFYISTMGGAGYVFRDLGIDFLCITGSRQNFAVMEVRRENDKITVDFHDVDVEKIWKGYEGQIGVYALQQYVFDNYGKGFKTFRIMATGPAAFKTRAGAIGSAPVVGGKVTAVDCWAGRGGIGSKLVQQHKIVAVIYGGDYKTPPDSPLKNRQLVDEIFEQKFQKKMIDEDTLATIKYRFDPKVHSGGTFGVNFSTIKGKLLAFNYQSVNWTEAEREELHKKFVIDHYLKQFNEETIEPKQFKHCGEPCGALCKKMNLIYKKDYEPYQTLGPNSGVFDQRAAEKLNHFADAMGFDAIQVGTMVSWIMECILKKKFPRQDFGFTMEPRWDWKDFDVVNDSMRNADFGCEIIDRIINDERCAVFRSDIRHAAKELDRKYNTGTIHLAVFNAFGEDGCMVPNQYWVPGMFSPMPIMGKYFEYYGSEYYGPRELGKQNIERMIKELYNDNTGICRFHRHWVEALIQELVNRLLGVNVDYYKHHRKLVQDINLGNKPVFWESERVVDLIKGYHERALLLKPDNAELKGWVEKFRADKWNAAKEFWQGILEGQNEALK